MSDKIREAFDAFREGVDERREAAGFRRLTNWEVSLMMQGYSAGALSQQAAPVVPDGWKLVPVRATREQVNAVCMHPDLARALYRSMVEAAPAAPVVPDGWKLVPVEPDPEMTRAIAVNTIGNASIHALKCAYSSYRAMLAAAPAAPVAVGREPVARAFGKVCGGDAEHNTVNVRVSGPVPPELWTIGTAVALYAAPPAAEQPIGDSASPVAEQPDTVEVPRELLGRIAPQLTWNGDEYRKLRALLDKEGEA